MISYLSKQLDIKLDYFLKIQGSTDKDTSTTQPKMGIVKQNIHESRIQRYGN